MKRERGMASWIKIFVPWENIYPSFPLFPFKWQRKQMETRERREKCENITVTIL